MSHSPIQTRLMRTYQVTLSAPDAAPVSFPVNLSYEVDGDNNAVENGKVIEVNSLTAQATAVRRLLRLAVKAQDDTQIALISDGDWAVRCSKQRFVQVNCDTTTGRPIPRSAR